MSDAANVAVNGTLRPLDRDLVSWTANETLAAGPYHATISAPSNPKLAPMELDLRSGGPRERVRAPQLVVDDWFTQRALAEGPTATCTDQGSCGGGLRWFREREASFRAVEVTVRVPDLASAVYWEMSIYPIHGKGEFQELFEEPGPSVLFFPGQVQHQRLVFAADLEEYCVVVHTLDRRDGANSDSPPQCWKAQPAVRVDEDQETLDQLRQCAAPPSPALTARWCALQPDPTRLPECQEPTDENSAGSAGSGGDAAGSAGDAGRSEEPPASGGARPDLGDDTGGEKSSSACSVGHSRGASGLVAAALMALAALGLRRRATRS